MWLNRIEFEILKRIKYDLSFDNLIDDESQFQQILTKLKDKGIIKFGDISKMEITQKGDRIFIETNYEPS